MAKYCLHCYAGVEDGDLVCGNCGAALTESLPDKNEPAAVEINQPATDLSQPDHQAGNSRNSNQSYTANTTNSTNQNQEMAPVLSLGDWMLTILLLVIPIVNIVMLIIWSSDSATNPNKKHYAQAMLIYMGIGVAIGIVFTFIFVAMFVSIANSIF